ncbi:MAG: hypothetical protein IJU82_05880, partial [Ruminiclostridium sp.]|nr:hypothetical protein [Ruminiclostridium sp.]
LNARLLQREPRYHLRHRKAGSVSPRDLLNDKYCHAAAFVVLNARLLQREPRYHLRHRKAGSVSPRDLLNDKSASQPLL